MSAFAGVQADVLLADVLILTTLVWPLVFIGVGVYSPQNTRRFTRELKRVFFAVGVATLILAGLMYLTSISLPRSFITALFVLDLAILLGGRIVLRWVFRLSGIRAYPDRPTLIIGSNSLGQRAASVIRQYDWTGLRLVGFLDNHQKQSRSGLSVLGKIDAVRQIVEQHRVCEVIIALPNEEYEQIGHILTALQLTPVYIQIVPDYLSLRLYQATSGDADALLMDGQDDGYGELQFINLRAPVLTPSQYLVKRAFDIAVSALLLLILSPVMLAIALAIKLDSPGPVLFRQKRVGENTRIFEMLKFRSMVQNAEALQAQVNRKDVQGNVIHKVADDFRVTRVGRFIRRTSLDELPQLINVLKGDMSLVGPRPELPWLVQGYETWQVKRFAVPQGITGWWQVNGRSNLVMHLNSEYDLYYVDRYSFLLDLWILVKTLPAVFQNRGAF
jgi:exopolysaccharide biosynthesis polyprenyl glycosylphosphotransferase